MSSIREPEIVAPAPPVQQAIAVGYAIDETRYPRPTEPAPRRGSIGRIFAYAALWSICLACVLPFVWMVLTSVKTGKNAMLWPPQIIPRPFVPQNYWAILRNDNSDFLLWTRNSLIIAVLTVIGTTISSAIVAYGFARIPFKGRGPLFFLMVATMMVPFPVLMVPLFLLFKWLGNHTGIAFLGTFKPLWVPAWFGGAFNIFLLRQFFRTIPRDLSDAARIDGCGEIGIFLRVIVPLSKPALTVVALFAFMAVWNDFLGPLVYLQRPEQFTLALGLQNLQSQNGGTPWHLLMAASVMVIAPVLALFFLAQRTFIEGIATTGIKG